MSQGDVLFITIAVILMALEPFLCSMVNRLLERLRKRHFQAMTGDTSGTATAMDDWERLQKGGYTKYVRK